MYTLFTPSILLIQGRDVFLMKVLKDDFKATGKCNMEMGKENYLQLHFSWATQKKSPYLDPLNKRLFDIKTLKITTESLLMLICFQFLEID